LKKRRIFAPSTYWFEDHIRLDKFQSHHLKDVLRFKIGSQLYCFDETGRVCQARIDKIQDDVLILQAIGVKTAEKKIQNSISLAQSIIKSNCMDLIIQKSVELGVYEIIPFTSENSVIRLDEKREQNKLHRWGRIAVEAVKQSGAYQVPCINHIVTFGGLVELSEKYDIICIAHPYSQQNSFTGEVAKGKKFLLVIGPEGGFTQHELNRFNGLPNSFMWSFHSNILRAETAAISALSILNYQMNRNYDE